MINFINAKFIKSAPSIDEAPFEIYPEIVFVGKSNVGKSSLINALTNHKNLAFTSSKPGHTKLLNYYLIDNKFYLVDAPGYGYTSSGSQHLDNFAFMMEKYFSNPNLKAVIFLVDSRHPFSSDDIDFYNFIVEKQIKFVIALTKSDKLNQSLKAKALTSSKQFDKAETLLVSINNIKSIENLRSTISKLV